MLDLPVTSEGSGDGTTGESGEGRGGESGLTFTGKEDPSIL